MSSKISFVGAIALLPLAAQAAMNAYSFGNAFRLGSSITSSQFNITAATTTFVPGAAPASQPSGGGFYIWPSLASVTNEFVYGSFEKSSPASCSTASANEWCLTAQYVGKKGLISGNYLALQGNQPVTINFAMDGVGNYTSTAIVNGAVVSTVSVAAGRAGAFGLANVCLDSCEPSTVSQTYRNTTIVLGSAEPTFGSTVGTWLGTTYSGLNTVDGGVTWTVDEIVLPVGAYQ